ncbi:MAG: glycosyltransferase [Acidobacteria bacterium]|nr:glycosyltransferase [Acidobacteriota bacterium]
MRVLHVAPSLAPEAGGPARSIRLLADALRQNGVSVRIAAHAAPDANAIALDFLPIPGEFPTRDSSRRLAAAIADSMLVEIHSVWNATTTRAAALCRRAGVPYVLAPRGMLDPFCLGHHAWLKRMYERIADRDTVTGASGFHFLSEEERDRAVIGRPLQPDEVAVASNGAATPPPLVAGALRSRFPETTGRQVLLSLGRLDAIKGIDLQLEALARIHESRRPLLLVIGPDYGDSDRLRRMARRLALNPWVTWAQPVYGDERFSLLADADAVLLTSLYDANPVVATEALAAGAVLVATRGCGGLDAAARHDAALVAGRTAEDLAAAILAILDDRDAAKRLRERAKAYAASALSPEKSAQPLIALYTRILENDAPGRRRTA